jgi:hypothetical protein
LRRTEEEIDALKYEEFLGGRQKSTRGGKPRRKLA